MTQQPCLTFDQLKPLSGSEFDLRLEAHAWPAVLCDVEKLPKHNPNAEHEPFSFSLVVNGSGLPQGTYALQCDAWDAPASVFAVPISGNAQSTTLQVIFN